jgi:2-polyprenyl-3-methyl-5-hydroxy-6-metoxy-1,4-benzoquinol methylase
MPYSDVQGKDATFDWYCRIAPQTVVDIGAGSGTYARLMRGSKCAVPVWVDGIARQVQRDHWTAIEAWEPYVDEYGLGELYDTLIIADVRHLNWLTFQADLVIAGDVLEHMAREDAKTVLRRIRQGAANLIVSIPVLHLPQGAVNGNPYERHLDHWTAAGMRAELEQYGVVREQWIGDVLAYFWWSRESES